MNGINQNVVNNATRVAVIAPSVENIQQQVQNMVPKMKCMKNCPPKLSAGCDLCNTFCGDYYINPLCNYIGITGLLMDDQCIQFDERYGGCGECIGCARDCGPAGYCPWNGSA